MKKLILTLTTLAFAMLFSGCGAKIQHDSFKFIKNQADEYEKTLESDSSQCSKLFVKSMAQDDIRCAKLFNELQSIQVQNDLLTMEGGPIDTIESLAKLPAFSKAYELGESKIFGNSSLQEISKKIFVKSEIVELPKILTKIRKERQCVRDNYKTAKKESPENCGQLFEKLFLYSYLCSTTYIRSVSQEKNISFCDQSQSK